MQGTSAVMSPPHSPFSGFVCSIDFFLLTPGLTYLHKPVVLSRIVLTSCHSSIHTLADSQTIHALYYIPESSHTHSCSANAPACPLPHLSACAPPQARHLVFLYRAPCSRIISGVTSTTHTSTKSFFVTVSQTDATGAAPSA